MSSCRRRRCCRSCRCARPPRWRSHSSASRAFFIAGVTGTALGESAAWFVLAATLLAAFVRAIDIESWALLIPGGFVSRVTNAFGPRAAGVREGGGPGRARAARRARLRRDRALRGQRVGHRHCRIGASPASCGRRISRRSSPSRVIALLWLPTRIGRDVGRDRAGAGRLDRRRHSPGHASPGAWSRSHAAAVVRVHARRRPSRCGDHVMGAARRWRSRILLGFALTLPVLGGGEALARAAHELPPPRVQALRRTGLLTVLFAGCDDDARDVPRAAAGACERATALGECAAGRPRAAPGRAVVSPRAAWPWPWRAPRC